MFDFPMPVALTTKLTDFIDYENRQEDKYYYTPESFKHYDELKDNMTDYESVYQWRRKYVRKNMSGVVPTLTANMGTGGHNVPLIVTRYGFRKLTPRETFNIQGFPRQFKLPNQANGQLYKQAGNSVVVPVIEKIAKKIVESLYQPTKEAVI